MVLCHIQDTCWLGAYLSAKMQSTYSAAQVNWVENIYLTKNLLKILLKLLTEYILVIGKVLENILPLYIIGLSKCFDDLYNSKNISKLCKLFRRL